MSLTLNSLKNLKRESCQNNEFALACRRGKFDVLHSNSWQKDQQHLNSADKAGLARCSWSVTAVRLHSHGISATRVETHAGIQLLLFP